MHVDEGKGIAAVLVLKAGPDGNHPGYPDPDLQTVILVLTGRLKPHTPGIIAALQDAYTFCHARPPRPC